MIDKKLTSGNSLADYLTIGEAATFLGVSTATLRNWDRWGKLVPYRHPLNNYRLYKKYELQNLINGIEKHYEPQK
jgi:predicted site-specific integrase-resolvase